MPRERGSYPQVDAQATVDFHHEKPKLTHFYADEISCVRDRRNYSEQRPVTQSLLPLKRGAANSLQVGGVSASQRQIFVGSQPLSSIPS